MNPRTPLLFSSLLVFTLLFCAIAAQAQMSRDVVYLEDGAEYHGEVIAISQETVLVKIGQNIISIDATKVSRIGKEVVQQRVSTTSNNTVKKQSKSFEPKPLDRKVLVELRSGIALINPVGLEATVGILQRLGKRSALGISTGFMLSNRSIFSGFLEYRRYFAEPKTARFFLGFRPGIAVRPNNSLLFNDQYQEITYGPMKFLGAQAGWLIDSGAGIAMSLNFGMNFIWYQEQVVYYNRFGETTIDYYLFRPQASLSVIF